MSTAGLRLVQQDRLCMVPAPNSWWRSSGQCGGNAVGSRCGWEFTLLDRNRATLATSNLGPGSKQGPSDHRTDAPTPTPTRARTHGPARHVQSSTPTDHFVLYIRRAPLRHKDYGNAHQIPHPLKAPVHRAAPQLPPLATKSSQNSLRRRSTSPIAPCSLASFSARVAVPLPPPDLPPRVPLLTFCQRSRLRPPSNLRFRPPPHPPPILASFPKKLGSFDNLQVPKHRRNSSELQ